MKVDLKTKEQILNILIKDRRRTKTLEKVKQQNKIDHSRTERKRMRNKHVSVVKQIYNSLYPNGYPDELLNQQYYG